LFEPKGVYDQWLAHIMIGLVLRLVAAAGIAAVFAIVLIGAVRRFVFPQRYDASKCTIAFFHPHW
jgi:hypothetical protein